MSTLTFALLDETRRWMGHMLDAAGLGPVEAPFRVLAEMPGMRLRAYHPPGMAAGGPALLIVPTPADRGPALQHVAPLVAPIAHERLWPRILDWISDVWDGEANGQ